MRALVVYESMYGNTHVVASNIADGLRAGASRSIGRRLKRHGYPVIAAPESFLVTSRSALLDGEAARARRWGAALGVIASDVKRPAHVCAIRLSGYPSARTGRAARTRGLLVSGAKSAGNPSTNADLDAAQGSSWTFKDAGDVEAEGCRRG